MVHILFENNCHNFATTKVLRNYFFFFTFSVNNFHVTIFVIFSPVLL